MTTMWDDGRYDVLFEEAVDLDQQAFRAVQARDPLMIQKARASRSAWYSLRRWAVGHGADDGLLQELQAWVHDADGLLERLDASSGDDGL